MDLLKNLKQHIHLEHRSIECCVCLETKSTAIQNSCGHDVCEKCVDILVSNKDFRCPMCRQVTLLQKLSFPGLSGKRCRVVGRGVALGGTSKCEFAVRHTQSAGVLLSGTVSIGVLRDFLENVDRMMPILVSMFSSSTFASMQFESVLTEESVLMGCSWGLLLQFVSPYSRCWVSVYTQCPDNLHAMCLLLTVSGWWSTEEMIKKIEEAGFKDMQIQVTKNHLIWKVKKDDRTATLFCCTDNNDPSLVKAFKPDFMFYLLEHLMDCWTELSSSDSGDIILGCSCGKPLGLESSSR